MANVDFDSLQATFGVNTFGPLCVAKHFAPLLQKGSGLVGSGSSHAAILVNMSARVGSIGDNGLGGWYSYRMSKAALNMATKYVPFQKLLSTLAFESKTCYYFCNYRNLSIELGRGKNKVICLSLHPGTVETDLSRPYHKNVPKDKLFTSEYSVKRLLEVIDGASVKDTGKYIDWDGKEIPF